MTNYSTIYDCPAWNYHMAGEADKRYLLRLDNYATLPDIDDTYAAQLTEVYKEMYYQFVDNFGIGSQEAKSLELQRDILELQVQLLIDGDRALVTKIKMLQSRLDKLHEGESVNIFDVAATLSKDAGYDISPLRLTVVEFYSKLKRYEKEQMARQARNVD